MNRFFLRCIFSLTVILSSAAVDAGVYPLDGTKHDLSSAGTGSYKAISNNPSQGGTTEICIFCHTPHSGNTEAPLWNRASSAGSYQTYTSDVLGGLGYWGAEDPKTGVAHSKTRICLSCHDGTIALGQVVNMPNDIPTSYPNILMSGSSNIQSSSPGFIGLDLRDDHPVAIKHDSGRDSELVPGASVVNARLYMDGGAGKAVVQNADGNYIECTSCHNPHDNQWKKFLIASNQQSALCTACHTKRTGSGAPAHDGSGEPYNPDGLGTIGTTVGDVRCLNCHYSHKAGVDPSNPTQPIASSGIYLLSYQGDGACFNTTNRWGRVTQACHADNGLTARNIEAEQKKSSAHKYASGTGQHRALEANNYGWLGSGSSWHVECSDCHNSHTAGNTMHTAGSNGIGNSNPLYGAGGVSISWTGSWSAPSSAGFTPFESLGLTSSSSMNPPGGYFEYQICMKCHSSFAWGLGTPPNSPTLLAPMTDQAKEFNPGNISGNNASMHPVAGATGNTTWGTLIAPWAANRGNQTMYCSDCHTTNGFNAQGPHGSSYAPIIPMTYNNSYTNNISLLQSSGLGVSDDLCFKCHSESVYQNNGAASGTGFSDGVVNLHTQHRIHASAFALSTWGYRCVNCHSRVPHGYNRKAMIVRQGEGFPYEAGGTGQGKIATVTLAASGAYPVGLGNKNSNCTTVAGCHQ